MTWAHYRRMMARNWRHAPDLWLRLKCAWILPRSWVLGEPAEEEVVMDTEERQRAIAAWLAEYREQPEEFVSLLALVYSRDELLRLHAALALELARSQERGKR